MVKNKIQIGGGKLSITYTSSMAAARIGFGSLRVRLLLFQHPPRALSQGLARGIATSSRCTAQEKDVDPGLRLGNYPNLPWKSAQELPARGWWDDQDRRDKETTVSERILHERRRERERWGGGGEVQEGCACEVNSHNLRVVNSLLMITAILQELLEHHLNLLS